MFVIIEKASTGSYFQMSAKNILKQLVSWSLLFWTGQLIGTIQEIGPIVSNKHIIRNDRHNNFPDIG